MYALVNEGAKILEESVAQRASDIDVIYVNGYGFPAALGGPMQYADSIGLAKVYQRICEFAEQDSYSWQVADLLRDLAESGGKFNGLGNIVGQATLKIIGAWRLDYGRCFWRGTSPRRPLE